MHDGDQSRHSSPCRPTPASDLGVRRRDNSGTRRPADPLGRAKSSKKVGGSWPSVFLFRDENNSCGKSHKVLIRKYLPYSFLEAVDLALHRLVRKWTIRRLARSAWPGCPRSFANSRGRGHEARLPRAPARIASPVPGAGGGAKKRVLGRPPAWPCLFQENSR